MKEKTTKTEYSIHLLFLLYFLILLAERLYSLIASGKNGVDFFGSGFDGYVYMAAIVSLAAGVLYLLVTNRYIFVAPFTFAAQPHSKIDIKKLCYAAGVILVAGMVHTEYTIAPVQFGAYGALIAAMALRTAEAHAGAKNKALLWLSFVYVVALSMAIPVMYRTTIELAAFYYVMEAGTALALVCCFTYLLDRMFAGEGENLFFVAPIAIAALCDACIFALSWNDELNVFAFIFLIVSVALWVAGFVYARASRKKERATPAD